MVKNATRSYGVEDAKAHHEFFQAGYYPYKREARSYIRHVKKILRDVYGGEKEIGRGLELGIGTALFSMELANSGVPMDGVDKSNKMTAKFTDQQKRGLKADLMIYNQDCVDMDLFGRTYNHIVSHGYLMWIFDHNRQRFVLTSYTDGRQNNLRVLKKTAKHLRPGYPFLINVFPHKGEFDHNGDYREPRELRLAGGRVYRCGGTIIEKRRILKTQQIIGADGSVEWEKTFLRSKFSWTTAKDMLDKAGFDIDGFDENMEWFIARKKR